MMPGGFFFHEPRIEKESAVIIQTGDEIPLFISIGRELMMRGIVLDKFSNVVSKNFSVVEFFLSVP